MIDALVKAGPEVGLRLEKIPLPKPKKGEALIRPLLTALNQQDASVYKWDLRAQKIGTPPFVVGQEFVGEVIAVGEEVANVKPQEIVTAWISGQGSFAEAFCLDTNELFVVPEALPLKRALLLSTAAIAAEALWQQKLKDQEILIMGAGPLGLAAILLARQGGAKKIAIADIVDSRLDRALQLGADCAVNVVREVLELKSPPTLGFEMSGSPHALDTLIGQLAPGGHAVLVGLMPGGFSPEWSAIQEKDLTVTGFHAHAPISLFSKLQTVSTEALITDTFSYTDYALAYDLFLRGT
ncbi:MAG: zinc-binding dehydrogenase, partial [Chlamydiia bacterium]|nr:zinc-binding dehydrogenase [Chlamydiia bacterium]